MSAPTTSAPLYPPSARPSARALPLLLFLGRFVRNPLRSLPRAVYDEPIFTYGGARPLVAWVTDPGLIETVLLKDAERFPKTRLDKRVLKPVVGDGLLTAEGESWRWQRKLAAPMFRHGELLDYVPTIVSAADERVDEWRFRGADFMSNVEEDMTHTTFAVIARTVLAGIKESDGEAIMRAGRAYLDPITWEVASAMLMPSRNLWHPGKARMRRAAKESRHIVQNLVDRRRRDGIAGDDLLARMLIARDPDTSEPMSDERIVDNLATFLLAGHETTAKALTWTLYILARAQDWQERVREELSAKLGSDPFDAAALTKLPLTSRVLKEAMRLYPPVPVMTRVTAEPMTLGGKTFEKPTLIVIPIYAVHRHRRLWDDPGRFDPDRFLPENEARIPRTQFMPFGYGQRFCIGMSFAMIEATAILATLLRSVRVEWDGKHEPEPISRVTLRPKGGMPLRIRPI